jgi:hypothetical protein
VDFLKVGLIFSTERLCIPSVRVVIISSTCSTFKISSISLVPYHCGVPGFVGSLLFLGPFRFLFFSGVFQDGSEFKKPRFFGQFCVLNYFSLSELIRVVFSVSSRPISV